MISLVYLGFINAVSVTFENRMFYSFQELMIWLLSWGTVMVSRCSFPKGICVYGVLYDLTCFPIRVYYVISVIMANLNIIGDEIDFYITGTSTKDCTFPARM